MGISLRDSARTLSHLLGHRMVVVSTLCIERHGLDCYCLGINIMPNPLGRGCVARCATLCWAGFASDQVVLSAHEFPSNSLALLD